MNSDEVKNLILLIVTAAAPMLAKWGVNASDVQAALTALVPIAVGVAMHWNKVKVNEKMTLSSSKTVVGK